MMMTSATTATEKTATSMTTKIDKLNSKLVTVRDLQAAGRMEEAKAIVDGIMDETIDKSGRSDSIYNWSSPLGCVVAKACRRLADGHGVSSADHRDEIMAIVYCWLTDGTLAQANTDNIANFIGNRITYNGTVPSCTDVAREYGIYTTLIDDYKNGKKIKKRVYRRHSSDMVSGSDDKPVSIYDITVGHDRMSMDPQDIVINTDYDNYDVHMAADVITQVVIGKAKNQQEFIRYCIDHTDDRGIIMGSYDGVAAAMDAIRRSYGRDDGVVVKICKALRNSDVSTDFVDTYVAAISAMDHWTGIGGFRDLIIWAVAISAKKDI